MCVCVCVCVCLSVFTCTRMQRPKKSSDIDKWRRRGIELSDSYSDLDAKVFESTRIFHKRAHK